MPHGSQALTDDRGKADRSARCYALVMDGLETGLTDEKILARANDDPQCLDKYGDRLDAEVQRILDKEATDHDHIEQTSTCGTSRNSPGLASRNSPRGPLLQISRRSPPVVGSRRFLAIARVGGGRRSAAARLAW